MTNVELSVNIEQYNYGGIMSLTIDPWVVMSNVGWHTSHVIEDDYVLSQLYNYGKITADSTAVLFTADACLIRNGIGGSISGQIGVDVRGLDDTVDNYGRITGTTDSGISLGFGSDVTVNNFGVISAYFDGISVGSHVAGGTINNAGLITGQEGIDVVTAAGLTTSITNGVNGSIGGSDYGILILAGAISLNNEGKINHGIVDFAGGNNVIVNDGEISGGITFRGGNNGITNSGTISDSITFGGGNNGIANSGAIHGVVTFGNGTDLYQGTGGTVDQIICGAGNDQIILGNGGTTVLLGNGHAVVTAGSGQDTFWFSSHANVDRINDFSTSLDHIVLSKSAFAGIHSNLGSLTAANFHVGPHAATHAEHIIYDSHNGFLFYDPDGSGPAHQIHFATLAPHLALTAGDFLVTA